MRYARYIYCDSTKAVFKPIFLHEKVVEIQLLCPVSTIVDLILHRCSYGQSRRQLACDPVKLRRGPYCNRPISTTPWHQWTLTNWPCIR